jgi:TRAP transporter TAXI family solute receptor
LFRTCVAALFLFASAISARAEDMQLFTFGAGDVAGGYYAAATAICETVNRTERGRLRCSPDPTPGSIYNLNALRKGELDFALVQSDWHRHAYLGTGQYANAGPMGNLRSVMGLYAETFTLLVRRNSGVGSLGDLLGKRVDIGHPASGRHATIRQVLDALGIQKADFSKVAEYSVGAALEALCGNEIDATFLIIGHPNSGVGRVLKECDAVLVPIDAEMSAAIVAKLPDMSRSIIPQETYPEMETGIASVAVTATVVTRADMDATIVESLVRNTLANLDALASEERVLSGLEPALMRVDGLTAPLHLGAKRAFDENRSR